MPSGSPPRASLARAALAGSAACFGLMAVLARKLTQPGMGFTPGHLAVLRFVVGIALCLAVFRIRPKLYDPHGYGVLVSRGITGGLVVVLYFYALAHIPAGQAGIIYNLFPVIATYLIALPVLGEPVTGFGLAGVLLTAGGVAYGTLLGHRRP